MEFGAISDEVINMAVAIIGIIVGVVTLVGLYFITKNMNKYNTIANIWYIDPFGKIRAKRDKGGIFYDKKSDMKLFFLKKGKVGMKPDSIPYVEFDAKYFPKKEVNIFQHSLKNFAFIKPKISNPEMTLEVGEADVNWAVYEMRKFQNVFAATDMKQIMAFVGLVVIVFAILILVYFLVQKFEVLAQVATSLESAANTLAVGGTTVIS